jgi:pimeloyl-ACP methyl ester carboxylesterase
MLNFQSAGQGRRMIFFVHGNSQSLDCWSELIKIHILNLNFRLVTLDLPGHGNSFRSNDIHKDYSFKGMAEHLKIFLAKYEKEEFMIVANCFGANLVGEIGQDLKSCKGLVLLSPSVLGNMLTLENVLKPNPNIKALSIPAPTDEQIDLYLEDAGSNLSPQLRDVLKSSFRKTDPHFRTLFAESVEKKNYADELDLLEKSGVPAAVVFGRDDKVFYTDYLDKVPFPKWKDKTNLIDNSGHFPQLDQPLALSKLIKEFAEDCFESASVPPAY